MKSKQENKKIYDGYGHGDTKLSQKTLEFKQIYKPMHIHKQRTRNQNRESKRFVMVMATDTKQMQKTQEPNHICKPVDT